MDPHAKQPISLIALATSLWRNRQLILQLSKREVIGRYKGSVIGLAWTFFNPLFMLAVYTFIFSIVFKTRWNPQAQQSTAQFAIILFAGLIVGSMFTEVLNRAPGLIVMNTNYVKKVIFPLETLPVSTTLSVLFHSLVSIAVLIVAFLIFNGFLYVTVLLIPIVLLPLIVLAIGLAWILASLGVFLRDVGQTVSIITTMMIYLSPTFYPLTAVPERYRMYIMLNPLTFIMQQAREVLIWGHAPNWVGLGIYTLAALFVAWIGFAWFQRSRKGFADVL